MNKTIQVLLVTILAPLAFATSCFAQESYLWDFLNASDKDPSCIKQELVDAAVEGPPVLHRRTVSVEFCTDTDTFFGWVPNRSTLKLECLAISKVKGILIEAKLTRGVLPEEPCPLRFNSGWEGKYFSDFFLDLSDERECNLQAPEGVTKLSDYKLDMFINQYLEILTHESFAGLLSPAAKEIFSEKKHDILATKGLLSNPGELDQREAKRLLHKAYLHFLTTPPEEDDLLINSDGTICAVQSQGQILLGTKFCLGRGTLKPVYYYVTNKGKEVATSMTIKEDAKEGPEDSKALDNYKTAVREARILSLIPKGARGIVPLVTAVVKENHVVISSEFYNKGTLHGLINKKALLAQEVRSLAQDVVSGVKTLHDMDIVHRDIKPLNIVVKEEGKEGKKAGLIDFGTSYGKDIPSGTDPGEVVGSIPYLAPEIMIRNFFLIGANAKLTLDQKKELWKSMFPLTPFNEKLLVNEPAANLAIDKSSDVWSLGITLYELAAGQAPPWVRRSSHPMALLFYLGKKLTQTEVDTAIGTDIPKDHPLYEAIKCSLVIDIDKRCDIKKVNDLLFDS